MESNIKNLTPKRNSPGTDVDEGIRNNSLKSYEENHNQSTQINENINENQAKLATNITSTIASAAIGLSSGTAISNIIKATPHVAETVKATSTIAGAVANTYITHKNDTRINKEEEEKSKEDLNERFDEMRKSIKDVSSKVDEIDKKFKEHCINAEKLNIKNDHNEQE